MRVLAFADEPPPVDAAELVALNHPDAVVTLGDLQPDWIASLGTLDLPRLGVHGNHDGEHQLTTLGIRDLHLARRLPAADVLLCHCPPWGVNDEPDDPAHAGFMALRDWVERHALRYLLHGHTTPDPRTQVRRIGATEVVWVRGAVVLELRR